ncbi:hypothetical protein [Streptomyces olivaceoviridis]|uniref:hypothetical protein n=1 Tax=Streptomyces olivaceoviridis TaxID=1921 RepID=UPI0037017C7B
MELGRITRLEVDGKDVTHCIRTERETAYGPVDAVASWLRANDINPNDVPINGHIAIELETIGGARCIRYTALLRNEQGYHYHDPETDQAAQEERTTPLKAEPPETVRVPVLD